MEPLRPIFWGQGMFLQPQHFQQQDWYHDARLRQYVNLLLPFSWGVKSLSINEAGLQTFLFEIDECEVVTFDGTLLRFRGESRPSNARIEARAFERDLDPDGGPLSVYLGVRRLQLEESNLRAVTTTNGEQSAETATGGHRRYVLQETQTPDMFAEGEQTTLLQYLNYEAHILFDVPVARSHDYELVKVAEVQRSPDGKGALLSKRYIPPCVAVRSSAVLETLLKEIRDLLTAKERELAQYRGRQGGEIALGARDIGFALMRQMVSRYVPLFHHYLETGDIHPYVLYGLLRQLVGELATFSDTVSVLGARGDEEPLPPYRHDQLWPCFEIATRRAKELLVEMTTGPVGDVLLKHDGEYFSASLDPQLFAGDNRYYLAIKSDLTPPQLFRLLQETGKITSREEMPKLQKSFLFGLKIEVLESPPEELLMRAHYRYFLIDRRADHWQKIQQHQSIAVYCSSLPPETEMRLVTVYSK